MEQPASQPIKRNSVEHPANERDPLSGLNQTIGNIGREIENIDETNLTPKQRLRSTRIKEKIIGSTRRFSRAMRRVITVAAIIGLTTMASGAYAVDIAYEMNHYALEKTVGVDGQTIYSHPDQRTTHYLNILAGRDRFTDEDLKFAHENDRTARDLNILAGLEKVTDNDVEEMAKGYWKKRLKQYEDPERPLPANLGEMSSPELAVLYYRDPVFNRSPEEVKKTAKEITAYFTQQLNERAEFRFSTGNDMYDLVWKLEEESGNPRIRFIGEESSLILKEISDASEHYDPIRNIVYVSIGSLADAEGVVSEMSHGKQLKDNPLGFYLLVCRDLIKVGLKSGFSIEGFREAHSELYNTPGSHEYQAHKVIEPALGNRYPIAPHLKHTKSQNGK